MFVLQEQPQMDVIPSDAVLVFLKSTMCTSLGVERVTLWWSSPPCQPLPPLHRKTLSPSASCIESADLPPQHYFCTSWLFICGSDSSPCHAFDLAHEISVCALCCHANQFNRHGGMAAHPPYTHMQTTTTKHTHRATTSLGGARWWHRVTVFLASQHEEDNEVCLARGLRGQRRGGGSEKVRDVLYTQYTLQMSPLLICCSKRRSTTCFFYTPSVRIRTSCIWLQVIAQCFISGFKDNIKSLKGTFLYISTCCWQDKKRVHVQIMFVWKASQISHFPESI